MCNKDFFDAPNGLFVSTTVENGVAVVTIHEDGPRYAHDCPHCRFVGQFGDVDGYLCLEDGSVVRRASSEPSDYGNFPRDIAAKVPMYAAVLEAAAAAGLA